MNSPVYNVPMVPAQSSMTQQTQHRYATSIRRLSDGSKFQTPVVSPDYTSTMELQQPIPRPSIISDEEYPIENRYTSLG